jgi:Flp pilus assembly protein TadD
VLVNGWHGANRHFMWRRVLKTQTTRNSLAILGRGRHLRRTIAVIALASAGAVALAACGGPADSLSANQALAAGIAAQRAGHFGTATTDYAKVLSSEPKNSYALYDLGDVEQFQGQDAAAATHYHQALAVAPEMESALYNLAILDSTSAPATAKALYLKVIAQSPRDAVARLNLGRVLLLLGQKKSGDAQIELAVNLEPRLKSLAPPTS